MTSTRSASAARSTTFRIGRLLGQRVLALNNRTIGRIEELRAEMRGTSCEVTEYVIGVAGLLERLHVGVKRVIGLRAGGYVARWDQVDVSDPERPRLTCAITDLRKA